jgi:hypothetical protein
VSWWDRAACRPYPTAWWFPEGPGEGFEALAICREVCPVRAECLADALAEEMERTQYVMGIRGGMRQKERNELRREARKKAG